MDNFIFHIPTKIIFGAGAEDRVGEETALYSRSILLHYGGGSIKRTGLLDRVTASLHKAGVDYVELPGVKPNPRLSLVHRGIDICRENGLDFILAVGGGSVIDSAKAIAMGIPYQGDVWDFYAGRSLPMDALPVGTILTIPAAGSEASPATVITNEDGWFKRGFNSDLLRPQFSILDPELAFTLPPYQAACGAADILAHVMERYFTNTSQVDLTDRLCEAVMQTVIANIPLALARPDDYDAWAEVMWAGTLAHNDLLGTGRVGDWASHDIEHEISALYDVAHGAGLAVVFPAWMKYVYRHDVERFVRFAERVWHVDSTSRPPETVALEGIGRLAAFFISIGLPASLADMGVPDDRLAEMAAKCTAARGSVGNFVKLGKEDVQRIFRSVARLD